MEFDQGAFSVLANSFQEVSLFIDPSMKALRAYGPTFRFTGLDQRDLVGIELFSLFTPESSKLLTSLMSPLRARVQQRISEYPDESLDDEGMQVKNLTMNCPMGPVLVELKAVPRKDSLNESGVYYYMVTLNDLSYTKDLEKKKNSFFATMNHEMRTPLNGIIGLTESLRSGEKDKARKKHFDMMLNSAQCMLKLINTILDTAAMKNDIADLELSQVNLNNVVEEVVEVMKSAVDKRGRKLKRETVDVLVDLGEEVSTIDLDKDKIYNALEAVVNNGLKFTHNGKVIVRTSKDASSGGILIIVEDTGIGIAKEAIDRIFESFEQEDDDHENRKYEGLGLGLTLAKETVALHGGKLWVESEIDKGSKFFISLPPNVRALKLISEKQKAATQAAAASNSSGTGGTISQEDKDRLELARAKQAEQIDILQREVFNAMKTISHMTVDLEIFDEKFKSLSMDPRGMFTVRRGQNRANQETDPNLSIASHFLSRKVRNYEMPLGPGGGMTSTPPSRVHRNLGASTNFVYTTQ
jgi:signal transduction histidine kinase